MSAPIARCSRWWFRLTGRLYDIRWPIIAAVLNRIASDEMRHAALLLGFDFGAGIGNEGFLGHLHQFTTGSEIGYAIRYGDGAERDDAVEQWRLERSLFQRGAAVTGILRGPRPF